MKVDKRETVRKPLRRRSRAERECGTNEGLKKACVAGVERRRGSRVVPSEAGDTGRDQTCSIMETIGRFFFILRPRKIWLHFGKTINRVRFAY